MSTPREQNVDWERGRMLRIYKDFQATKFYCFPPPRPPPPPPPPHFYCFSSTTTTTVTTFLVFSLHHPTTTFLFFPPPPPLSPHFYCFPPPPPPPHFYCFPSTKFYKRLPTAIFSSLWSNVSCSEQQSWFSSAVSCLSRLSASVTFKGFFADRTEPTHVNSSGAKCRLRIS